MNVVFSIRILVLTFSIGVMPISLYSQRPLDFGKSDQTQNQTEEVDEDTGPDSTLYSYILAEDIFTKISIADTLVNTTFLHHDPMQHDGHEHINIGNRGSATAPLLYRPTINIGFNTGYNQYRIYNLNLSNFRFYEQNRPITDLYFTQLSNQQNLNVGAQFSRNFSDGLTVSVNYQRISQEGFYARQNTKLTNFGIGFRYQSPSDVYNAFLIMIHNANEEIHNGGIQNGVDINEDFKVNVPVILSEASSRQQEQSLALIQYYKLSNSKNKVWRLYLKNNLEYHPSYYKFSDKKLNTSNDSLFYNDLLIDNRGIRRFVQVSEIKNSFFINGERLEGIQGRLGLSIDHFNINNTSILSSRTDLTLSFDGRIPLFKGIEMKTNAKLGMLKNVGNFDLKGTIDLKVSKIATLSGGLVFFNSEPSLNTQLLVLNDSILFNNEVNKSIGTLFFADLNITGLKFQAGIVQSVVNDPVFFDFTGKPVQQTGVFSVTYLRVRQNLRLWRFHLDNQAHLQIFSDKLYPLPSFYSTHQLYYSGSFFNKIMDVNIGIDARFISDYKGGVFHPVYGQYYKTDSTLPFFPAANLYLLAKVSSFRVMLIMENFSQYFVNEINFDAVNQPQFDPKLRFGIQWQLKD